MPLTDSSTALFVQPLVQTGSIPYRASSFSGKGLTSRTTGKFITTVTPRSCSGPLLLEYAHLGCQLRQSDAAFLLVVSCIEQIAFEIWQNLQKSYRPVASRGRNLLLEGIRLEDPLGGQLECCWGVGL